MNIISYKLDKNDLVKLNKRIGYLNLPLNSMYDLMIFLEQNEKIFQIDSLSRLINKADGTYLEGDEQRIKELLFNPSEKIEVLKKMRKNTLYLSLGVAFIGLISSYAASSDKKYTTVDFCFIPEKLYNTSREHFCKPGNTIYRTAEKFLMDDYQYNPNPAFLSGEDTLMIPNKGRHDLKWNKATNPNYLGYAIASCMLTSAAYWLYSQSLKSYKIEFPELFGLLKTYTLKAQLEQQQNQYLAVSQQGYRADYLQRSFIQDKQALELGFQNALNPEELVKQQQVAIEANEFNMQKQNILDQKMFELQLSQIDKERFDNLASVAKNQKEIEKIENGITDSKSSKNKTEFKLGKHKDAKELDESENITWDIIRNLLTTKISTIIVGTTGAGKSVLESFWFYEAQEKNPNWELYALVQKSDYPPIIKKDNIVFFRLDNPKEALDMIDKVHEIYLSRRDHLNNKEKKKEYDNHPVRLLLADWLSINSSLEKMKNDELVASSQYLQKLLSIILNGRACNVGIIADLQSFNVAAIGLQADKNIRRNLNILILGNFNEEVDGTVNDSYGVITNALDSHNLISEKEERDRLKEEFARLQPISKKHSRPILFSSIYPMTVSLVPSLMHYADMEIKDEKSE